MARLFGFWRGMPRAGKWILSVSLALNLFLIGAAAGGAARHHYWIESGPRVEGPDGPRGGPRGVLRRVAEQLPEERRDALRALLIERRQERWSARREMCAAADQLRDILTREPLDLEAFGEALRASHASRAQGGGDRVDLVITFAEALSPEERRIFAEAALQARHGWAGGCRERRREGRRRGRE